MYIKVQFCLNTEKTFSCIDDKMSSIDNLLLDAPTAHFLESYTIKTDYFLKGNKNEDKKKIPKIGLMSEGSGSLSDFRYVKAESLEDYIKNGGFVDKNGNAKGISSYEIEKAKNLKEEFYKFMEKYGLDNGKEYDGFIYAKLDKGVTGANIKTSDGKNYFVANSMYYDSLSDGAKAELFMHEAEHKNGMVEELPVYRRVYERAKNKVEELLALGKSSYDNTVQMFNQAAALSYQKFCTFGGCYH